MSLAFSNRAALAEQETQTDESLLARIAAGDGEALHALYGRHAGRVFAIASRLASRSEAEEVVQEISLSLWKNPGSFDADKGKFSSWLSQVAKHRALNLRRRSAKEAGSSGLLAASQESQEPIDLAPLPDEASWLAHRREVLSAALESLPAAQRRAVSLAFLDELPHAQVAAVLGAPLGTVKTRIRLGLKQLAALVAAAALGVLLFVAGRELSARRTERALRMVTASDVVPLHLAATAGVPPEAHGSYRARPGAGVAVLTTSNLPKLAGGARYRGWARTGEAWVDLGPLELAADGRSVTVAENPLLAQAPDELRVTVESAEGAAVPGAASLEWLGRRP